MSPLTTNREQAGITRQTDHAQIIKFKTVYMVVLTRKETAQLRATVPLEKITSSRKEVSGYKGQCENVTVSAK